MNNTYCNHLKKVSCHADIYVTFKVKQIKQEFLTYVNP
jgi:hypothetical protein